jgi:hypothetical protein
MLDTRSGLAARQSKLTVMMMRAAGRSNLVHRGRNCSTRSCQGERAVAQTGWPAPSTSRPLDTREATISTSPAIT